MHKWQCFLFIFIISNLPIALAATDKAVVIPAYKTSNYDEEITELYRQLPPRNQQNFAQRLDRISRTFLGHPYLLGALGEGEKGTFQQQPLYRTDAFDCVTFVSTVLALAQSENLTQFKQHILNIRYEDGNIDFKKRNHFTTVDWNMNNANKGLIKDITYRFVDQKGKPVATVAKAIIDKPDWYQHLSVRDLQLLDTPDKRTSKRLLKQLHRTAHNMQQEQGVLLYIPLNKLFDKQGKVNQFLLDQIPSGAIVEIVRPNWNLKKQIGTHLNVSHMGFAIRTKQGLMYRNASSLHKHVSDTPLVSYLRAYLNSPTIKGINVQMPVGQKLT